MRATPRRTAPRARSPSRVCGCRSQRCLRSRVRACSLAGYCDVAEPTENSKGKAHEGCVHSPLIPSLISHVFEASSIDIAGSAKPVDGIAQAVGIRTGTVAELALRLFRTEEHSIAGHAQSVEGEQRLAPGDPRDRLRPVCQRKHQAARQTNMRWRAAHQPCDVAEQFG